VCFQFRFKCRYSDVEVISDGARKSIPDPWWWERWLEKFVLCIHAVVRSSSICEEEASEHEASCCQLETRRHGAVLPLALLHTHSHNTVMFSSSEITFPYRYYYSYSTTRFRSKFIIVIQIVNDLTLNNSVISVSRWIQYQHCMLYKLL